MEIRFNINGKDECYNLNSYGKDVISFGRSAECDISIQKDYLDELQGCFYLESGKWYIKNLGESQGILLYRYNSSENRRIDNEELKSNSFFMIRGRNDLDSVRIYLNNRGAAKKKPETKETGKKTSEGKKKDKTNIIIIALVGLIFVATIAIGLILILKSKEETSGGGRGSFGSSGHLTSENNDSSTTEGVTDTAVSSSSDTEEASEDTIEYMDKDEFIEYLKENDIDTDNDKYYRENSNVISVVKADEAKNVLSEAEVYKKLKDLGLDQQEISSSYTVDGKCYAAMEISEDSDTKHPMYQTYYTSASEEVWTVYVINDVIMVNPASYNLEKERDIQVCFSEKDTVTSYDYLSNSFYETVPNETELKVIKIDKINSAELDKLTVEEIDKLVK